MPSETIQDEPSYETNIEVLTPAEIAGWVWRVGQPDLALKIDIVCGGNVVATTVADIMRPDLLAAKKGSGRHGFVLKFDPPLRTAEPPLVRLSEEPYSPLTTFRKHEWPTAGLLSDVKSPLQPDLHCEGYIETLTRSVISGWVWRPDSPNVQLTVEVMLCERVLAKAVADTFRPDLQDAKVGTGRYGFVFTFDPPIAGSAPPTVRVAESPSQYLKTVRQFEWPNNIHPTQTTQSPDQNMIESNIEIFTRSVIAGWVWKVGEPDLPLNVDALVQGQVIASTVANVMRQDLLDANKGSGRHGFLITFDPPLGCAEPPILKLAGDPEVTLSSLHELQWPEEGEAYFGVEKPSPYESNVEIFTRSLIAGWVWRTDKPDLCLPVEAVVGDKTVAVATADILRHDLITAKKGSGRHGFELHFDPPLKDGIPIIRLAEEPRTPLNNTFGRAFPSLENELTPLKAPSEPCSFQGAVDFATNRKAIGWAWDPSSPQTRLTVEAVQAGQVIGTAACDRHRDDLRAFGKGDGDYGFEIEYDAESINYGAFQVRVSGTDFILPFPATSVASERPRSVEEADKSPSVPTKENRYEVHIDAATRESIHGWAWCPKDPERQLSIEAILNDQVIGRTRANTLRQDLVRHGKGTGRYGFSLRFYEFIIGDEPPLLRIVPDDSVETVGTAKLPVLSEQHRRQLELATVDGLVSDHLQFTQRGPEFEEIQTDLLSPETRRRVVNWPLIIAFYLPQFHSIPENNAFWGEGFTEWRQLPRGLPRFPGHYQPRIPRDLGFYTLGSESILSEQVRMAAAAGVGAFCYYYYWFNGKRVLEAPLDVHLNSSVDMPFLVMWANENWTKTWDGFEDNVLLRQDYKDEDEDDLIADLARHFKDSRYVRLEGRPLFIIYNIRHVPEVETTVQRWREKLTNDYDENVLFFMAQAFEAKDPRTFKLDGAIEFPPHKLAAPHPGRETPDAYSSQYKGRVIAYDDFVSTSLNESTPDYPLIKTAVPSWDNDARRPNRGLTLEGVSPRKYQTWIAELVQRALDVPVFGTPVLAINAWNEWAEAAYLEPDVYFGAAFLNATARGVLSGVQNFVPLDQRRQNDLRVSVIMPCYNHARFLPERIESVTRQLTRPDEIIFLDDCSTDDSPLVAERLLRSCGIPFKILRNARNSGGVFRQWLKGIQHASHELIWIAETDDSCDKLFLSYILPAFDRHDVMAVFGKIQCIDPDGNPRDDLKTYFDGFTSFSWDKSVVVPAAVAFGYDFAVRNVIPNASGLVFRKPSLTASEVSRLTSYTFAGDWFFYSLVVRGGSLAYRHKAKSYFRVNPNSASRSSFFGEKHLREHQMVLEDLAAEYGVTDAAVVGHSQRLAALLPGETPEALAERFRAAILPIKRRFHFCIAAHSFGVGGGEVLPLELANGLRARGFHVSYLVLEREIGGPSIRGRLRNDIPVFYWSDVCTSIDTFVRDYQIGVFNSHNVGVEIAMSRQHKVIDAAWIVTLHGGYETVPQYIDEPFISYVGSNVDRWLFIAEKNKSPLLSKGLRAADFVRCFNSVRNDSFDWIDRDSFRDQHGIPREAFCVFICSRAIPEKGWNMVVEVAACAARMSRQDVHVCLIGTGPAADEIKTEQAGNRFVHVLGYIENPIRFFRCFDLGMFPSVYAGESFPLFLLECFEAGVPVLSTDIGEIPYIMDGEGQRPGWIVPWSLDQPEIVGLMADYVVRFMTDIVERRRARLAARHAADRFNFDKMIDFYVEQASEVVHRRQELRFAGGKPF